MKVIFLDIDGVLNTKDWDCEMSTDCPHDKYGVSFDPAAVDNLAHIISQTGAEIVISSSWKFYGLQRLREMWHDRNLPGTILDITPNSVSDEMLLNANLDEMELGAYRGSEIKEWLLKHHSEVSQYVIIDDYDDMLSEQECHLVITNSDTGISKCDAEKAIIILDSIMI